MKQLAGYISIFISVASCVEPFDFETRTTENVLVVEAIITNEIKRQQVILSRASNLEEVITFVNEYFVGLPFESVEKMLVNPESDAVVTVADQRGNIYSFTEVKDGVYHSDNEFAATQEENYQLKITTVTNESYESERIGTSGISKIDSIYAERSPNASGDDGISIYVDGSDVQEITNHFRYTYEETYKIVAPNWTSREYEIIREEQEFTEDGMVLYPAVNLVERTEEQQVCYKTDKSNNINLVNTTVLDKPKVVRNLVRFIDRNDHILSHRYSILVRQYLQSVTSNLYYQNLDNFTKSESVFSEIQPGFLEGNIKAINVDTPVVGYFEVASVAEKRFFFSYDDFFLGEDLPPRYFFNVNCDRLTSPQIGDPELDGPPPPPPGACPQPLVPQIRLGLVTHVSVNSDPDTCEGPYWVTPSICGDCTVIGSNVKPDFWVE